MKTLIHDVTTSFLFWLFLVGCLCMITFVFWLVTWVYQSQIQHEIDRSALKSVGQIKATIAEMRAQDAKAAQDRNHIKKDMEEIKEDIQGVPPQFMRAGKAFRKGVDQLKAQGTNP